MFQQAQRFHRAAQHLRTFPEPEVFNYAMPALLLSYAAIEIYLKCLIYMHNGQHSFGHDLRLLFRQLPPHWRDKIKRGWKEHLKKIEPHLAFGEKHTGLTGPRDLIDALEAAAISYETSRYLWESEGKENYVLMDLTDVLQPIVRDISRARSAT